jgi:predicted nuclease of predicted toxin-antitoxin system
MTRILPDQGLAPHTAAILRRNGFNAAHVSEIGVEQAEDIQIMEKARIDERVCVTLDHDFHAHLAMTGHGRPSVVLLRVQGLDAQGQADLIRAWFTLSARPPSPKAPQSQRIAKASASGDCRFDSNGTAFALS